MSTRYYPLYQRGNPQLRVFLPNFWMKLIKSEEPLPPNVVLFRTSIEMTKYDVKNYLEKIYKVPVVDVKITIKPGDISRRISATKFAGGLVKDDDYKEALVYMRFYDGNEINFFQPKDYVFEFPKIGDTKAREEMKRYKELKKTYLEEAKVAVPFLPKWFAK